MVRSSPISKVQRSKAGGDFGSACELIAYCDERPVGPQFGIFARYVPDRRLVYPSVGIKELVDGSLLVSDDILDAIYRIGYSGG